MKKKLLALVCAMTMVLGMSVSVCAAGSNDAESAAEESTSATIEVNNEYGQKVTANTLAEMAETTTVAAGPAGVSVAELSVEATSTLATEAVKTYGASVFCAAYVDLNGGAGTYTLGCPNVWAGQTVVILHEKADGSFEYIAADKVENNKVTFTMTSTSPIAILVTNATAPKTGDVIAVMALLAAVCAGGAVVTGRKAR